MNVPDESSEEPSQPVLADVEATPEPSTPERRARRGRTSRRTAKKTPLRTFIDWVVVVGAAVLLAVVVKAFVLQAFFIPSESMEPTLMVGDRVMVDKVSYRFGSPHRGDVVVFEPEIGAYQADIKDLIKRVIGLPGETIEAINGEVYVNGKVLAENWLPDGVTTFDLPKLVVPEGRVLLLGDNRGASQDGRGCRLDWLMTGKACATDSWEGRIGPVKISSLVGRARVLVWPFGRARTL